MSVDLSQVGPDALADEISTLAVHAAWYAANIRTFVLCDASLDAQQADRAYQQLADMLPSEVADSINMMIRHIAWQAANTQAFVISHASEDRAQSLAYAAKLRKLLPVEIVQAIRLLAEQAALHSSNIRALLWEEAALNNEKFEAAQTRLRSLLWQVQQMHMHRTRSEREAEQLRQTIEASLPLLEHELRETDKQRIPGSILQARFTCACTPLLACFGGICSVRGRGHKDPRTSTAGEARRSHTEAEHNLESQSLEPRRMSRQSSSSSSNCSFHTLNRCSCVLEEFASFWRAVSIGKDGVPAAAFLQAASATAPIFDICAGGGGAPKADLLGNIRKIEKNIDVAMPRTLQQMIDDEIKNSKDLEDATREGSTARALLWLSRMLRWLWAAIAELKEDPNKAPAECAIAAYESTLAPHHPWVQRRSLPFLIRASGYSRAYVISKFGNDPEMVEVSLGSFLEAVSPALDEVVNYLKEKGIEHGTISI